MWARLHVRLLRPAQEDLKISVLVSDGAGHVAGQIDKLLLNNILHQGTTRWPPGTEADAYYLIPVLPATAPGRYSVQVAVYGASSQMRLPPSESGDARHVATLGTLTVRPELTPPQEEALRMTQTLSQPVAPGLTLLGYSAPQDSFHPGDRTSVALLWRADAPLGQDFLATLWASQGGDAWPITSPLPVGDADYPTSRWTAGEVVRGWIDGRLPPDLPSGEYWLSVRVTDSRGQNRAEISLGPMTVTGWTRRFEMPEMQNALRANFGNQLELLGYDLRAPTADSPSPEVVLYWRALSGMDVSSTTFVHVLDEAGQVVAQVDHVPGDGALPTTGWLPQEVVADRFVVPVQADRIGAARQIEAGAYDPLTMQRLPTLDADGAAIDTRALLPLTPTTTQAGAP
jgi:hypothetical protein